jgi:hypothetical protein
VAPQRAARDHPVVKRDRTAAGEAHVIVCAECPRVSSFTARGWKAYRTDDIELDEPPTLAFYCPECARREFGDV